MVTLESNYSISPKELEKLRKQIRKRKKKLVPRVFDGLWASEPGIGGAKFYKEGEELVVKWLTFLGDVKTPLRKEAFVNLVNEVRLEFHRYELGIVLSQIFLKQGHTAYQEVLNSIGHPIDAYREARKVQQGYTKEQKIWRFFAIADSGYF